MGLNFKKELTLADEQVYPPCQHQNNLTRYFCSKSTTMDCSLAGESALLQSIFFAKMEMSEIMRIFIA